MPEYLTLTNEARGEYEEKRSRFIAAVIPCCTEQEAAEILAQKKSEYWDARHNVYAYILKDGASRFSDDGEPHGTAGKPVLDVLSGSGLKDVIVVVTRYFGGVLLGTGGLVRAYSSAAREALAAAQVVKMTPCIPVSVTCPYSDHGRLTRIIEDNGGNITDTEFAADVTVKFTLLESDTEGFSYALRESFSARLTAVMGNSEFLPIPIKK